MAFIRKEEKMSIWSKIYSKINWKDEPIEETPLSARNLNKIDSALDEIDKRVVEVNNRVETLVTAEQSGDEVTDIRVGYDGSIYPSAGASVRSQVSQLSESIDENYSELRGDLDDLYNEVGINKIVDIVKCTPIYQGYLGSDSETIINVPYQLCTKMIYVGAGKKLFITPKYGYRVYISEFMPDGSKISGHGYYTFGSTSELVLNYDYIGLNISKDPYSTSDVINVSDAENIEITYIIEPTKDNNISNRVKSIEDNVFHVATRNLWTYGDIEFSSNKLIGTQGIKMFDSGKYTISFNTEGSAYFTLNIYSANNVALTKQVEIKSRRTILHFNSTSQIERFGFIPSNGTVKVTDIKVEAFQWSKYYYTDITKMIPTSYETDYIEPFVGINEIERNNSYWKGKKAIFNGDSVTQGISVGNMGDVGYVQEVTKSLEFGIMKNYAIGGTRLAHVDDVEHCMVDRIEDMDTDADLVFIMCNTNDYASQVPIGNDDSMDITTYKGALNSIFTWLKSNYPTQPIIISTMLTRKNDGLPIKIEEYAQAVRDMVEKYNFILFDAYKVSGLDLLNSPRDGSGVTNDGLHPNVAGAESLGRKIAKFIDAQ